MGSLFALVIIYVLPAKYIRCFLGHPLRNRELCVLVTPQQLLQARQISSLMKTVANNVPWPCKCLAQALCVNWLFKVQGIPSVTYLGAMLNKEEVNGMKAHAWVCIGANTIIGNHDDDYAVVGTFSSINFLE
ncbi:MAG: lasso peptide biosynthesis B2 protein [Acidiferrobacterales bacterium]|nr:lasso peptide biosynthesis B2 protein [Acidiferrobacterales bacterium]